MCGWAQNYSSQPYSLEDRMSERFANQVVLMAGATGGLGRAVSYEFLSEGAIVVVTYKNGGELVNSKDQVKQLVRQHLEAQGWQVVVKTGRPSPGSHSSSLVSSRYTRFLARLRAPKFLGLGCNRRDVSDIRRGA
jgi:shikimate 5-dehydrogenase